MTLRYEASHHERLDGSGYPYGLLNNEISIEGRIIAAADSFDSMVSKRIYTTTVKSFEEAARELVSMPRQYDTEVCRTLMDLVRSGEISRENN